MKSTGILKAAIILHFFIINNYGANSTLYTNYVTSLINYRSQIKQAYRKNNSLEARDSLITETQTFLLNQFCDSLFPYWYGTEWDFYGQSRIPGQGKIACGYFVTTLLEDAGFNIPRTKWAKSASEYFIKILSHDLHRFRNEPVENVFNFFRNQNDGLFLVGLDCHVGFIFKRKDLIKFVHSSYYYPSIGVMAEDLIGENPFNDSKYRVVGRILDKDMVIKWILNIKYQQ